MRNNKYSNLKIATFPEKIQSFKEGRVTAPIYVRIKPINRCNHDCFWCVYTSAPRKEDREHLPTSMHTEMVESDMIPTEKMLEIIHDLRAIGVKAVTYSGGGEPLFHPDIVRILRTTTADGLDLSIITNGQSLSGEKADALLAAKWVRISMDYYDAGSMQKSRGVPPRLFDQLIRNIEQFASRKPSTCDLGVNFIVHRDNYQKLLDVAVMLMKLGVNDVRFSPMWCDGFLEYHTPIAGAVQASLDQARALVNDSFMVNSTYNIHAPSKSLVRTRPRCFYMQVVPVIGADLCVYTCHNKAYDDTGKVGSIANCRFSDLWFSDKVSEMFTSFDPVEKCRHECANHDKVNLMYDITEMSTDNFV